ncbi:MAG: GPW/gp25 family protein [Bacteroidota bacterium]
MIEDQSFLGRGWTFPPAFVKGLDTTVVMSQGEENIKENLHILFSTRIGERLMKYNYGTKLKSYVFDPQNATLIGNIKKTVKTAILLFERRIKLDEIKVELIQDQESIVNIEVQFTVRKTNNRANFVYPFYLTEGTNIRL